MKTCGLVLFMIFSFIYSEAQILPDEKILADIRNLPSSVNYNEFQRKIIEINKITRQEVYKYQVKSTGQTDSTLLWETNFIYGNKGRIIEQQNFDKKHTLLSKKNFYYNELDMLIKEKTNDNNGYMVADLGLNSVDFDYDNLGRIEYESFYNRDTTMLMVVKNVYNNKNYLVKQLMKLEVSSGPLRNANQKLAFRVYKLFQLEKFRSLDSLFYNDENKIIKIQNYDITGTKSSSYLVDYDGSDPMEITLTKQAKNNTYMVGKVKINKFNQIVLNSLAPEETEVDDYRPEKDKREKLYYNTDGTLNTCIAYTGNKVRYIYKFIYKNN